MNVSYSKKNFEELKKFLEECPSIESIILSQGINEVN
jgi:hypothetical protein